MSGSRLRPLVLPVLTTRIGDADPSAMWSLDGGVQLRRRGGSRFHVDVGAGLAATVDGTWSGNNVVPSLRLLVGRAW